MERAAGFGGLFNKSLPLFRETSSPGIGRLRVPLCIVPVHGFGPACRSDQGRHGRSCRSRSLTLWNRAGHLHTVLYLLVLRGAHQDLSARRHRGEQARAQYCSYHSLYRAPRVGSHSIYLAATSRLIPGAICFLLLITFQNA